MRDGWTVTDLDSATRFVPGRYLPRAAYEHGGPYPVFGSNSLMGYASAPLVPEPCVVMAAIGAYAGAVRLSPTPSWVNNNALALLPSNAGLMVEYLHLWLGSMLDVDAIRAGTGQPYVKRDALRAQPVSYPPLAEQRRIVDLVASLDDLRSRADALAEAVWGARSACIEIGLAQPAWPRVQLRDIAVPGGLIGGPFGSDLRTRDYVPEGTPVINGANHSPEELTLHGPFQFVSDAKAKQLRRNTALPFDVVATNQGTVGQVSRVPATPFPAYVVSQRQLRLRVDPARATTDFVVLALRAPDAQRQLAERTISTAVTHINLSIFSEVEIPLPPLSEQRTIVAEQTSFIAVAVAARDTAARVNALRSALLADLLSGDHAIPASYDRFLDGAA